MFETGIKHVQDLLKTLTPSHLLENAKDLLETYQKDFKDLLETH